MITKGTLINGRWTVLEKIGKGSHGQVFRAVDITNYSEVAVKVEARSSKRQYLFREFGYYRRIANNFCPEKTSAIVNVLYYQDYGNESVMVFELLGPSLAHLFRSQKYIFSTKTVLMLFKDAINGLERIHQCGIIHRDLKPQNICMGRGINACNSYIIDLGLSKLSEDQQKRKLPIVGTARFASRNAHSEHPITRKDDLESLCYVFMYLLKGRLPWDIEMVEGTPKPVILERFKEWKLKRPSEICESYPVFFEVLLNYVRSLKRNEKPKYSALVKYIDETMAILNLKDDGLFDWFSIFVNNISIKDVNPELLNQRYDDIVGIDQTPEDETNNTASCMIGGKIGSIQEDEQMYILRQGMCGLSLKRFKKPAQPEDDLTASDSNRKYSVFRNLSKKCRPPISCFKCRAEDYTT